MATPTDLEKFPRPGVTVDLAILTVTGPSDTNPELRLLVQDRTEPVGRALPGGFIRERWTVARTVDDVLRRKVGIEPTEADPPAPAAPLRRPRPRRPHLGDVCRPLGLAAGVRPRRRAAATWSASRTDGRLEGEGPLLFDHDQIVATAVESLRERYEFRYRYVDTHPDPDGFLPEPFTLHQLRKVHEAVVGAELHKDNFNRRMKPFLEPLTRDGEVVLSSNLRGRPATLYRSRVPR